MARSELERKARIFTDGIQSLLNSTLCDGYAVVNAIPAAPHEDGRELVAVGTGIGRDLVTRPTPLRSDGQIQCWLDIQGRVFIEPTGGHLTVESSYMGVSTDPEGEEMLFHYDYERGKQGYTEAHLQLFGDNEHLTALLDGVGIPKQRIERLHFPVGGRRFRPSLEDILDFLVCEKLACLKDQSQETRAAFDKLLREHRNEFRKRQLSAAIRRDQETARLALEAQGWTCFPPTGTQRRKKKRK